MSRELVQDNWLRAHLAIWPATLMTAYLTSGAYSFASCWTIIALYLPPIGIALLEIPVFSVFVIGAAIINRDEEASAKLRLAVHGLIFTIGWFAAIRVAYAGAGQVNCL